MPSEALLDLVRRKLISPEEALARAVAKADLRKALESAGMMRAAEA
jgi:hypothetical protein